MRLGIVKPSDWEGTWSLSDYIVYLVASGQKESLEYKSMLRFYGEEKLNKIWDEHVENESHREPGEDDD